MKKTSLICILILMVTASVAAAGGKTAYVNTQTIVEKTKLGKKYLGIIREYVESRKKILDIDFQEIQNLQETYRKQQQAKALNEKARKEKEEILGKKMSEFEKKRDEFSAEIGKKNEELMTEFHQKMTLVIKGIAKKESISLVLSKNLSKTETPSVLYGDEDLDLTERVIEEMDKKEPGK